MFFKQPPEVGKLTHIIISAHGRAGANTGADIWKGGGLRQRPERKGPATYVSGEFRARPEASHKTPTTEFCKTAATATTQPPETAMGRAFQGVVAPHFFRREKGMLPPLLTLFLPQNDRWRRKIHQEKGKETNRKRQGC